MPDTQNTPKLIITSEGKCVFDHSGEVWVYSWNPHTLIASPLPKAPRYVRGGMGLGHEATLEAPPTASEGFVTVRRDGRWEFEEDHRGETIYDESNGYPQIVHHVGTIPDGFTLQNPPACSAANGESLEWTGTEWVVVPPSQKFIADRNVAMIQNMFQQIAPMNAQTSPQLRALYVQNMKISNPAIVLELCATGQMALAKMELDDSGTVQPLTPEQIGWLGNIHSPYWEPPKDEVAK